MNLVDAYVTKIKGTPEFKYGKWFLKVEADCYGRTTETELMFNSKEDADRVEIGYHFLT